MPRMRGYEDCGARVFVTREGPGVSRTMTTIGDYDNNLLQTSLGTAAIFFSE